ncbi:MAG: ABC transporter permease [Porphyromonas sp.]|nr:ABC transporter permease [Porphyromonas sp.]
MSKIGIIIGREYWMRVRKKSFFLLTFLTPLLFILIAFLPIIISKSTISTEKVVVLDKTGQYLPVFKDTPHYKFVPATRSLEEYKQMGRENAEEITAVLEIRQDLLEHPDQWSLFAYKQLPSGITDFINKSVSDFLTSKKLQSHNIPELEKIVKESQVQLSVPTYKWSANGEDERTSGTLASIIGIGLTMVIFLFINSYGSLVMAGVLEEKKNRIMEVMVSSVKPFDMMMGKIIGIGLVGITQIILWVVLTSVLLVIASFIGLGGIYDASAIAGMSSSDFSGMLGGTLSSDDLEGIQEVLTLFSSINVVEILTLFIIFFVGGFMLYASLFAAIGASVSGDEDTNQFITPVMIIMFIGFYSAFGSMQNPEGPLAFWCSMIPFTSPIVMMVRLPYDVPLWQELLSIVILYGSFIAVTWISAKVYRVGILLYGKKPSYKDLWKWIRHS